MSLSPEYRARMIRHYKSKETLCANAVSTWVSWNFTASGLQYKCINTLCDEALTLSLWWDCAIECFDQICMGEMCMSVCVCVCFDSVLNCTILVLRTLTFWELYQCVWVLLHCAREIRHSENKKTLFANAFSTWVSWNFTASGLQYKCINTLCDEALTLGLWWDCAVEWFDQMCMGEMCVRVCVCVFWFWA